MDSFIKKKRRTSCEDSTMFCFGIVRVSCDRFFSVRDDFICFRMKLSNALTVMFCFLFCLVPIRFILVYISRSIWIDIMQRCWDSALTPGMRTLLGLILKGLSRGWGIGLRCCISMTMTGCEIFTRFCLHLPGHGRILLRQIGMDLSEDWGE